MEQGRNAYIVTRSARTWTIVATAAIVIAVGLYFFRPIQPIVPYLATIFMLGGDRIPIMLTWLQQLIHPYDEVPLITEVLP
jgi:hypothetical protein